jgi:hypothetical protein
LIYRRATIKNDESIQTKGTTLTSHISHQDFTNDDLLETKNRNSFKNKEAFRSGIRLSTNHGDKDIYRETTRTTTTATTTANTYQPLIDTNCEYVCVLRFTDSNKQIMTIKRDGTPVPLK